MASQLAGTLSQLAVPVLAVIFLGCVLTGCGSRARSTAPIVDPAPAGPATYGPEAPTRAPSWSTLPNSWGKLNDIERWITATPGRRGFWANEAQLQLAEGQLAFSTNQLEPGTDPSIVTFRQKSARDGFRTVLAAADSTPDQRGRAQRGLAKVGSAAAPVQAAASVAQVGGLIRRAQWRARRANQSKMRRATARWRWITVHHSVFSAENGQLAASLDTVQRIQRAHMDNEGYADIGYHFLIDAQGRVIEGRQMLWQGAHAGGTNNVGNVGICLLGNFDVERPSRAALASLDKLVLELQTKFAIPRTNVRPHLSWKETACPGRHMMPWFTRS